MAPQFEDKRIRGKDGIDTVEVRLINRDPQPVLAKVRMDLDTRPLESGMFQLVAGLESKVIFTVASEEEIVSIQILDSTGKPFEE